MELKKHDLRDTGGRYDVGYDAKCVCGHSKGVHVAGDGRGAYECIVHDEGRGAEAGQPMCPCEKFRKARAKKERNMATRRKRNRAVEAPAAPQFVTLANVRYLVRQTRHGYVLTGPRGATYQVVRNVHRPDWLLVSGHYGRTPRQFARGLTDRAGYLQVL